MARIQSGDASAENEFASAFKRQVFVVLLGRISDQETCRELTQDVLLAVLQAIRDGKIREPEKLPGFMHGVVRNIANNHLRRKTEAPVWIELDETALWVDAEEEAEMADRKRLLNEALMQLEPDDRRILALSIVEGRSAPEVAAALGLSPDAIRQRKSRALRRVGDVLRARLSRSAAPPPLSHRGAES